MRTLLPALVLGLGTAVAAAPAGAQAPPAPTAATAAGSVEKGRVTFARVGCAQCHGREGQGSPTTGPRLGPGGLAYQSFSRYVRAPRQQMPPYADRILPDTDLADIYAFVQSRPRAATPRILQP
jgi:ubiquinol-cytochrome c reductase cytochrome c subunit